MEALRIMRHSYIDRLVQDLGRPEVVDRYRQPSPFKLQEDQLLATLIVPIEAAPALACASAGGTEEEAENALAIHRWLGPITPVQASDPRLWSTLTHTLFWDYVKRRWPALDGNHERRAEYVTEHWFTRGGKAGLRRNAISRLWWAAELTLKPWEKDPEFEEFRSEDPARFTRILVSNQQLWFDLLERDYGSSPRVRICMLDAFSSLDLGSVGMTRLSRQATKDLNCLARTRNIDAMDIASLRQLCRDLVSSNRDHIAASSR